MKSREIIFLFLILVFAEACSRLKAQPESKTNVESTPSSVVEKKPGEEIEKSRRDLYMRAQRYMQLAVYNEAARLWKEYIDRYFGMQQYAEAQFHYARALFQLSRLDEATAILKPLIETPSNPAIFIHGRLLLAEILIKQLQYDQAIAATYDLLPEIRLEKKNGVMRSAVPVKLEDEEKVKVLTLRGRVFGEIKKENDAVLALAQARKILKSMRFSGTIEFQKEQKDILTAHVAFRQIETLSAICKNKVYKPNRMSENEFIKYAQDYYDCAKPTQSFMCEVLQVQDDQVRNQAVLAYREMADFPTTFKENLPPPARRVKPAQAEFYKSEMKGLIDNTVQKFSYDFRNIKKCDIYDVY